MRIMNDYCPECETDLDRATGICPACRWDPLIATDVRTLKTTKPQDMSLTERYRGTPWDVSPQFEMAHAQAGISKGRALVIFGLVSGAVLYGLVLSLMGPL
jgi:predicted ATP-dependent serine protease